MRVIVAGSRSITDRDIVYKAMVEAPFDIDECVHGACSTGVDKSADLIARSMDVPIKTFSAKWDKYGKSAGPRRNKNMAEYADALIAVWDGESSGTRHMIQKALKADLDIYIVQV